MVVKLTQEQADYLETFGEVKNLAFFYIGGWGYNLPLKDGNERSYSYNEKKPFRYDEKEKMLNALINGYEVDIPKYKFYNYANISGSPLYYVSSEKELNHCEEFAKEIEKCSEEYVALEKLGFCREEV